MLWTQVATSHGLRATIRSRFLVSEQAEVTEPNITVVDRSSVDGDLSATLARAASQFTHRKFIATAPSLTAAEVAAMMHKGVVYALERPHEAGKMGLVLENAKNSLSDFVAKRNEYDELNQQFSKLTSREVDVLQHVLQGTSNREAAEQLNVSVRTVESRRAKLYRKLRAQSLAEVVRKTDRLEALREEVVPPVAAPSNFQPEPHVAYRFETVA